MRFLESRPNAGAWLDAQEHLRQEIEAARQELRREMETVRATRVELAAARAARHQAQIDVAIQNYRLMVATALEERMTATTH